MADAKNPTSTPAVDKVAPPKVAPFNFDDLKNKAVVIEGYDLRDKGELVGVEFVITGVMFKTGSRNVGYAYVDGVTRDGQKFTFVDSSSTGAKNQIIAALQEQEIPVTYDTGEVIDIQIYVPRGFRVSDYSVEVKGKERNARTFYLTAGGE